MIKNKLALAVIITSLSTTAIASSNNSVVPFEFQKEYYKSKEIEKHSKKRVFLKQEDVKKLTLIQMLQPDLENEYKKITNKKAKQMLSQNGLSGKDYFLSGLFFYEDGKYQSKPLAIQQFNKGHLAGNPASSYMLAIMNFNGEGVHSNKEKAITLLNNISGDERIETFASMKVSEYLFDSGQPELSLEAYKASPHRDRDYKIGLSYLAKGNEIEAIKYFTKAVDSGYREAGVEFAKLMLKQNTFDLNKVVKTLEDVRSFGVDTSLIIEANLLLGDIYHFGTGFNYSDHQKAVGYYDEAAKLGSYSALIKLNNIYLENEPDNKYRLGKNKDKIHKINLLIKEQTKSKF